MTPVDLTPFDLTVAAALVVVSATTSIILSIGVERRILVASTRVVAQLLLVAFFLRTLFSLNSPWATMLVVGVMLAAASTEMVSRGTRRIGGWRHLMVGFVSVVSATVPVVLLVLATALRPDPWYDARHAIPLVGIVLGTVMNAGSLTLGTFLTGVVRERPAIEARLALGSDRFEALRPIVRQSILTGIVPTLNQMSAAGIITLPGIMTGQVLAGMDPVSAGKYQILLMLVLSSAGFFGSLVAASFTLRLVTDTRHRLRLDNVS